jgi:repressor of nif and glnA expression
MATPRWSVLNEILKIIEAADKPITSRDIITHFPTFTERAIRYGLAALLEARLITREGKSKHGFRYTATKIEGGGQALPKTDPVPGPLSA